MKQDYEFEYYSKKTKQLYKTKEEAIEAEKEFDKKVAEEERKTKALLKEKQELEQKRAERFKEVQEAYKRAEELKRDFLKDYHTLSYTISTKDLRPSELRAIENFENIFNIFDEFTRKLWF